MIQRTQFVIVPVMHIFERNGKCNLFLEKTTNYLNQLIIIEMAIFQAIITKQNRHFGQSKLQHLPFQSCNFRAVHFLFQVIGIFLCLVVLETHIVVF